MSADVSTVRSTLGRGVQRVILAEPVADSPSVKRPTETGLLCHRLVGPVLMTAGSLHAGKPPCAFGAELYARTPCSQFTFYLKLLGFSLGLHFYGEYSGF